MILGRVSRTGEHRDGLPLLTGYGALIGAGAVIGAYLGGPVGALLGVGGALLAASLIRILIEA